MKITLWHNCQFSQWVIFFVPDSNNQQYLKLKAFCKNWFLLNVWPWAFWDILLVVLRNLFNWNTAVQYQRFHEMISMKTEKETPILPLASFISYIISKLYFSCFRVLVLAIETLCPHYFHSPWWKEARAEKQSRVQSLKPRPYQV